MANGEKNTENPPSLMATVAAIVAAALQSQGIILLTPSPSPWKAAQRDEMARGWERPAIGWGRITT